MTSAPADLDAVFAFGSDKNAHDISFDAEFKRSVNEMTTPKSSSSSKQSSSSRKKTKRRGRTAIPERTRRREIRQKKVHDHNSIDLDNFLEQGQERACGLAAKGKTIRAYGKQSKTRRTGDLMSPPEARRFAKNANVARATTRLLGVKPSPPRRSVPHKPPGEEEEKRLTRNDKTAATGITPSDGKSKTSQPALARAPLPNRTSNVSQYLRKGKDCPHPRKLQSHNCSSYVDAVKASSHNDASKKSKYSGATWVDTPVNTKKPRSSERKRKARWPDPDSVLNRKRAPSRASSGRSASRTPTPPVTIDLIDDDDDDDDDAVENKPTKKKLGVGNFPSWTLYVACVWKGDAADWHLAKNAGVSYSVDMKAATSHESVTLRSTNDSFEVIGSNSEGATVSCLYSACTSVKLGSSERFGVVTVDARSGEKTERYWFLGPRRVFANPAFETRMKDVAEIIVEKLECDALETIVETAIRKSVGVRTRGQKSGTSYLKRRERSPNPMSGRVLMQYPKDAERAKSVGGYVCLYHEDIDRCEQDQMLNDNLVDYYIKYLLLEGLGEETRSIMRAQMHVFSSFFYKRLIQGTLAANPSDAATHGGGYWCDACEEQRATKVWRQSEAGYHNVRRWTRNVDIFSKTYLVVPVNEHLHWSLAIVCNPSLTPSDVTQTFTKVIDDETDAEDDASALMEDECKQREPCIIVLDSLGTHNTRKVCQRVRHYLDHELYRQKHSIPRNKPVHVPENARVYTPVTMPTVRPRVPRQTNDVDCGVFLLKYFEQFCAQVSGITFSEENIKTKFRGWLEKKWFANEAVTELRFRLRDLLVGGQ